MRICSRVVRTYIRGMTPLTRRRDDTENLEQWSIYDGDVQVGLMRKVNATGGQMIWQWSCGLRALAHQPSGSADTFDEAREAFQKAWEKVEPQITPEMRTEWLEHRAFTAWKYAMQDANCRMPTQNTTGRSHCFCGAEIAIDGVKDHIRTAHMGTNLPART